VHAQANFGVGAQLGLHLTLVDLAVRPVLLAFGHATANHTSERCGIGNLGPVLFISRPIGTQHQAHTMTVLTVDQHVFVH